MRKSWLPLNLTTRFTIAILSAGLLPCTAMANSIELASPDGTVNLSGEFVGFSDNHYTISTALGELRIDATRVQCEGAACPSLKPGTVDVTLAGSGTVGLGILPQLIAGYAEHLNAKSSLYETEKDGDVIASVRSDRGLGNSLGNFLISSTSSSTAFQSLADRSADIGMSSRRIQPKEVRQLRSAGAGYLTGPGQEHVIAVDSLVVIMHPDNPIDQVSIQQLRDIYAGQIDNWSSLGGPNKPIKVISRPETSGTRSVFESRLFGDLTPSVASNAAIVKDNDAMAKAVIDEEGAIGFVSYAFQGTAKPVSLIDECGIPTTPDAFSAKTEDYPFQRRLYLYNRADDLPAAANGLMDFAMSSDADSLIAEAGFIDLGIDTNEQSLESARGVRLLDPTVGAYDPAGKRQILAHMANFDRLSTTFRFRTGSKHLDERGAFDMERLVDYLEGQPNDTKLLFVGFTDAVGRHPTNKKLSITRAGEVQRALTRLAGEQLSNIEMSHTGFGELIPSACNNTQNGQAINRRVEVWISKPKVSL